MPATETAETSDQTDNPAILPDSVRHITILDKDIYLVGTAHVSQKSVTEVEQTIRAL